MKSKNNLAIKQDNQEIIGIPVEKYIKETDHNDYYVIHELMNDKKISIEDCKNIFHELKENGIIVEGNFEDDIWAGYNFLYDCKNYFEFYIPVSTEIILSIKKYLVLKMGIQKRNLISVKKHFICIKNMLIYTHMLHPDYVEDYKKYVLSNRQQQSCQHMCKEFLAFTSIPNASLYYNNLKNVHIKKIKNPRDIPCYESVILFDMLIRKFIDTESMNMKIKYYPVLIWWVISSIIPLRASEFILLKRDCIYEKQEKFYIHIERIKKISNRQKYATAIMTEFQIPKNLYDFLKDFKDFADELDDSEYLISHNYYSSIYKLAKYKDVPKINLREFNTIFNHFAKEIIENTYGYKIVEQGQKTQNNEIERIKAGDTRHLAFMNMMLQGLNPLYIQRIGGHYTLNEQIHYCQHIDTFMSSKVYLLSKFLKEKDNNINFSMNEDINAINWSMKQTEKELLGLQFYNLPLVKGGAGRCTSKNVPFDCICEECLFCQHFIPEKNVSQEYIEEMKKNNQQNIEIKKKLLQTLLKEQLKNEHQISIESKNLAALTNQKMIIDAYRLNIQEDMKEDDTNE